MMNKNKIQEETSTKLKQPAFIDFYNLKLQADIVYKEVPKDILRNEDEPVYAQILDVYYPIPPEELTPPGEPILPEELIPMAATKSTKS